MQFLKEVSTIKELASLNLEKQSKEVNHLQELFGESKWGADNKANLMWVIIKIKQHIKESLLS